MQAWLFRSFADVTFVFLGLIVIILLMFGFFFFKDTATTEIYTYCHTLSLHDALPIRRRMHCRRELFDERHGAGIDDGMDGIEAQAVEVVIADPAHRVLHEVP